MFDVVISTTIMPLRLQGCMWVQIKMSWHLSPKVVRNLCVQEMLPKSRRNPELWHQLNRFVSVLIVIALLIFVGLLFYPEWVRRGELASQLANEQTKLTAEQLLQKQRAREVVLLQNDPEYFETIARDKIGVMKEGETIMRLEVK